MATSRNAIIFFFNIVILLLLLICDRNDKGWNAGMNIIQVGPGI